MIKQIHSRNTPLIEFLLCARHCARLWVVNKTTVALTVMGLTAGSKAAKELASYRVTCGPEDRVRGLHHRGYVINHWTVPSNSEIKLFVS